MFSYKHIKSFFLILISLLLFGAATSYLFNFSSSDATETVTTAGPSIEWLSNGIIINDTKGNSAQKNPKIILSGGAQYITVWEDNRNGYFDIYAQKIGEDGFLKWRKEGIAICQAPENQSNPQMISDGKGGAIVVWEDYRESNTDIYAQRIDSYGVIKWKQGGVPLCQASRAQLSPKLVSDGHGGAIITWYDYRSRKGEDIYAQRIDENGNIKWSKNGVEVVVAPGTQWYPEIISDGDSGAIITWTDFRDGGESDIYAQRIDKNGKAKWEKNGIPICVAPENQAYPKLAIDGKNGAIIVWEDFRNGNSDIYAQRVKGDGSFEWKKDGEAIYKLPYNQEKPQIVEDGEDGAIIAWIHRRGDSSNIFCQRVRADGLILWGDEGKAICKTIGFQDHLAVISPSLKGGAVFTWEDKRDGKTNIYAQSVTNNGTVLWNINGIPVCDASDDQEYPAAVSDKTENIVFVWQDKREGSFDIYAEKLSANGKSLWKGNGITVNASIGSVSQQGPKLIFEPLDKAYIITWEDSRNGYSDIYAQKVDEKGNLKWDIDGVAVCQASGLQTNPQIIQDGRGNVIVVWEDLRSPQSSKIYAQKLNKYGKQMWQKNGIEICHAESSQSKPKIISDGKGRAMVIWSDYRSLDRGQDIYIQKISPNGDLLFGEDGIAVCLATCDQDFPEFIPDGAGGAIIVWTDYRGGSANSDIYAQRIDEDGELLWLKDGVPICIAPEPQRNQKLSSDGKGGAIIVWTDKGGGGYDIYGQRINKDGKVQWTVDGIPICQVPGTQRDPKIVRSGKEDAILIWEDYRSANWDIYAQKIDGFGNIKWGNGGVPICTVPYTQYAPGVISDDGSAIITWEDYRNGIAYNIFAQKVDNDGDIMWQKDGIEISTGEDGARNPEIISNGAHGAVIGWEDYRGGGYGIYAQRIKLIKLE